MATGQGRSGCENQIFRKTGLKVPAGSLRGANSTPNLKLQSSFLFRHRYSINSGMREENTPKATAVNNNDKAFRNLEITDTIRTNQAPPQ
jgi:hypothetical protein